MTDFSMLDKDHPERSDPAEQQRGSSCITVNQIVYKDTESRDKDINTYYPERKCSDCPGTYDLPNGNQLHVYRLVVTETRPFSTRLQCHNSMPHADDGRRQVAINLLNEWAGNNERAFQSMSELYRSEYKAKANEALKKILRLMGVES